MIFSLFVWFLRTTISTLLNIGRLLDCVSTLAECMQKFEMPSASLAFTKHNSKWDAALWVQNTKVERGAGSLHGVCTSECWSQKRCCSFHTKSSGIELTPSPTLPVHWSRTPISRL